MAGRKADPRFLKPDTFLDDYYPLCVVYYNGNAFSAGVTAMATAIFVLALERDAVTPIIKAVIMLFIALSLVCIFHFWLHVWLMQKRLLTEPRYAKNGKHDMHRIAFWNLVLFSVILFIAVAISVLITLHMFIGNI